MEKGKRIEAADGEFPLPEAIIHHIQSFMSGKEAARTTLLSKSWYTAWLTRPSIDLDYRNFDRKSLDKFRDFANKTMQRYQDLSLKIQRFSLSVDILRVAIGSFLKDFYRIYVNNLIVNAMKIGATHVQLEVFYDYFTVPQEVLASQTLIKLSIRFCRFDGNYIVSCSNLKSLSLHHVELTTADVFDNIISCNSNSLEELSLNCLSGLSLSRMNLYDFHKLTRLFLRQVDLGTVFSSGFASRFPCLNDLSIIECRECTKIQIASTSLQTISFNPRSRESWRAKFDVPFIRKFIYSGSCSPCDHLSIKAAPARECEFDVSISCNQLYKISWFQNLKKYLSKFKLLRMSLSLNPRSLSIHQWTSDSEHAVDIELLPNPLVVETLMIDDALPSYCCALLVRLFGICRPKFITHYWFSRECLSYERGKNKSLDILCKRLMQRLISPKCGIPDQSMFGKFGLKKANVEVYEMFDTEWRPRLLEESLDATKTPERKRKVRFELIWD